MLSNTLQKLLESPLKEDRELALEIIKKQDPLPDARGIGSYLKVYLFEHLNHFKLGFIDIEDSSNTFKDESGFSHSWLRVDITGWK